MYLIIGGSLTVLKYSVIYFFNHSMTIQEILTKLNTTFDGLNKYYQVLVIFVCITITMYICERLYKMYYNNDKANYVAKLVRESLLIDNQLEICEDDLVNSYSEGLQVSKYYFIKEILPEVKRLLYLDGNIEKLKSKFFLNSENVEVKMDVWAWKG